MASKKKRPLSSEDKLKLTTLYELLQWKRLDKTAAALAKEADLSIPSNKQPQNQSQEALWSRLSMQPQTQSESSSDSEEESDSDSESSDSESSDDSDSADSEEITSQKKVHVQPLDGSCLLY